MPWNPRCTGWPQIHTDPSASHISIDVYWLFCVFKHKLQSTECLSTMKRAPGLPWVGQVGQKWAWLQEKRQHRRGSQLSIFSRWRFKWQLRKRKEGGEKAIQMQTNLTCRKAVRALFSEVNRRGRKAVCRVETLQLIVTCNSLGLRAVCLKQHGACTPQSGMLCGQNQGYTMQHGRALPQTPWVHCTFGFEFTSDCCTFKNLLLLPN